MYSELEFDGGAINDDGDYDQDEDDFDDTDIQVDDHENQDEDFDKSGKTKEEKPLDEDLIDDINNFEELVTTTTLTKGKGRRKVSGYPIISFTEYVALYSNLCDYISKSKIEIPPEMADEEEVKSCDIYRTARFWIRNRSKYPIPLGISRHILGNTYENVDVNKSILFEELDFHDDNNDEYRFDFNFNKTNYNNSS